MEFLHKTHLEVANPSKDKKIIILWLMLRNSILTKDNLIKIGRVGNDRCHLCLQKENITHLMFGWALAKLVWQVTQCAFNISRPLTRLKSWWEDDWDPSRRTTKNSACGGVTVCWIIWKIKNYACSNQFFWMIPRLYFQTMSHILQKSPGRESTKEGMKMIKEVIQDVYTKGHG